MTSQTNGGAASAAPSFDAVAWTAAWTAIGGGYARTATGLFLSWDAVTDAEERTRLHQQIAPPDATRQLISHLDARQTGR